MVSGTRRSHRRRAKTVDMSPRLHLDSLDTGREWLNPTCGLRPQTAWMTSVVHSTSLCAPAGLHVSVGLSTPAIHRVPAFRLPATILCIPSVVRIPALLLLLVPVYALHLVLFVLRIPAVHRDRVSVACRPDFVLCRLRLLA
jgi:hypothetical protein